MTQEEIIELKKFCIEIVSVFASAKNILESAQQLFDWLIKEEDDQPLNDNVVPYNLQSDTTIDCSSVEQPD